MMIPEKYMHYPVMILIGMMILVIFIYMVGVESSMETNCIEPITSSTKICNEQYFPKVATNFGWSG